MKRICVMLLVAISSFSIFSCKEKTPAEKFKERMEKTNNDIKDKTDDAADETEKGAKKAKKKLKDLGD